MKDEIFPRASVSHCKQTLSGSPFLQDNYTFAQPGIQKKVKALEELVSRIDGK